MANIFRRVISASLSPNTQASDVWRAMTILFSPWNWLHGKELESIERWFDRHYHAKCVTFNSARSALFSLLHAFDIGKGDEVIIQAFTCVAVPNSILWTGATPVYADIDNSYNIDPRDIEKKITNRTKAVIVQHTFGVPANMDEIFKIAKKHNLWLFEDCAHALGAQGEGKVLGTIGDAAFFSFGRDKVLSSVWGGAAIVSLQCKIQSEKLKKYHKTLAMPSVFWILQQLVHPIAFSIILPLYNLGIGKLLLVCLQKLNLLSFPVYSEEKHALRPPIFPSKYPNALAVLLAGQLQKLDRYVAQRIEISKYYDEFFKSKGVAVTLPLHTGASYLRYPILVDEPDRIRREAKKRGILLGSWYHNIIDPQGVDFSSVKYQKGSCPNAEEVARRVINLPTRITMREAKQVLTVFRTT